MQNDRNQHLPEVFRTQEASQDIINSIPPPSKFLICKHHVLDQMPSKCPGHLLCFLHCMEHRYHSCEGRVGVSVLEEVLIQGREQASINHQNACPVTQHGKEGIRPHESITWGRAQGGLTSPRGQRCLHEERSPPDQCRS